MGGIQQRVLGNFWDVYCTTTSYAILLSYDLKTWVFNFQLFGRGLFSGTISQGGRGHFSAGLFLGNVFPVFFPMVYFQAPLSLILEIFKLLATLMEELINAETVSWSLLTRSFYPVPIWRLVAEETFKFSRIFCFPLLKLY